MTLWEVNIGINIFTVGLHKTSDETSKAQEKKRKMVKLDFSKLKQLCASNYTAKKVKKAAHKYLQIIYLLGDLYLKCITTTTQ